MESSYSDELDIDLEGLMNLKYRYPSNPFIAYLNINFLQNKIDPLREILHKTPLEIVCIDETKLDDSFPDQQF